MSSRTRAATRRMPALTVASDGRGGGAPPITSIPMVGTRAGSAAAYLGSSK